jgi:hypothetical protein
VNVAQRNFKRPGLKTVSGFFFIMLISTGGNLFAQ